MRHIAGQWLTVAFALLCLSLRTAFGGWVLAIFPHVGYSHFKVFYPIVRELADRGHHVTVVSYCSDPGPAHDNYEELLLDVEVQGINLADFAEFPASRSPWALFNEHFELHREGQAECERFYSSGVVAKLLERHWAEPYDLLLLEYFNTDCYLGVARLLGLHVVGLSSCALMPYFYDRISLPDTPAHVQSEFVGFGATLNWHERLLNFVQMKTLKLLHRYHTNSKDAALIARHLQLEMDVDAFARRQTSLIMVNQHRALSGNRPTVPQLIEIGGVHMARPQNTSLGATIAAFLEADAADVMFISWGSVLRSSTLPQAQLAVVVAVLRDLPLRVIWKWEADETPLQRLGLADDGLQFLFVKWAPQQALACHPKVRLFWGHGGLLSTTEAVYCGKPMVLTPVYGDQFLNAHAVQNRHAGRLVPFRDLGDRSRLSAALDEALHVRYASGAQVLSHMFRQRENAPLNTSVWWIEHLLQHPEAHGYLQMAATTQLNWFTYHSLDTVVLLLLFAALPAVLWIVVVSVNPFRRTAVSKCKAT